MNSSLLQIKFTQIPHGLSQALPYMKTKFRLALLFLGLLIASSGTRVWAQYEDGSLIGTIRDASGASVANASITVTNINTGISTHLNSNGAGDYEVPSLRVGVYSIEASAPGFAVAEAKNITVSVGNRQHIDLILKVGLTTSTVEVSDVALQIETATSERGQTITNYQTESLPLVSRNYSDLVGLVTGSRQAPTAATTTAVTSLVRAGAYNVNGERSMFNNYLLDGMDNNAYGESNQGFDNQIIPMPPDSVAQFQVVTNNESAEYGRSSGALVNVASLSGTNRFHAKIYEFIRNTDLNAYGYIKPVSAQTGGSLYHVAKPGFNRNQFGADFGGPIIKDRLFYFLDYEGFRQTLTPNVVLTVPTENEINRILAVDVEDPFTGTIYPHGMQIPTGVVDTVSQQVLALWGNLPSQCQVAAGSPLINTTTGIATNDCPTHAPFTDNSDKGDLRFDFQQSANSSWFLRVSDRKETGINFRTLPGALDGQTNGRAKILDQQIALGYTHLFGANKVLDARIGLSGTRAGKYTLSIGDPTVTVPGLPSVAQDPTVAGGLPSTSISGGFTAFGRQSTNPQWQNPSLLDPKVNFSWVKGHHSLKFGYEYEHIWMEVQDSNPLYGSFTYGKGYSLCTNVACTTNNGGKTAADNYWADFLFGTLNNYALATYFKAHLLQTMHNLYVQDDWKVNNKLTLNLGLRWEYGSPYSEANNNLSNFDPTTATMLTLTKGFTATPFISPNTAGGVYGSTLVNPSLGDYAPRVGFAYAVTPKIVVRGGYGTSFVHYTRAGSGDILAINAPNALFVSVTQGSTPSAGTLCPSGAPATSCFVKMDEGFPNGLATNFTPGTDNITYVPKNTKDSYVESYYLSAQRELAKNTILDVAYVANHGLKLQGFLNANQQNPSMGLANPSNPTQGFVRPYPTWGSNVGTTFTNGDITEALNGFYSHYDSLQVRLEERFVNGLTALNSFTWEHSSDNASASLEGNTPSPQDGNNLRADYAQSDYNLPLADILSLNYEIPVGHGKQYLGASKGVLDAIVGGWQVNLVNTAQAGTPYNLTYTPGSTKITVGSNTYTVTNTVSPQISATYRGANEYRPNAVSGQPYRLCHDGHSCLKEMNSSGYVQYANLAAYTLPSTTDVNNNLATPFGTAGRNPGRTPSYFQADVAVNKTFSTPIEGFKVEFRSELYNITNHTNLYLPSSGLSGTIGTGGSALNPTSGGLMSSTFEPRIIQFGLKLIY
jgi:hypothetical protein